MLSFGTFRRDFEAGNVIVRTIRTTIIYMIEVDTLD